MTRDRILGISVGAIAAVSLLVVLIFALGNEPEQLDPSTPEGVVQTFVTAIADSDWVAAHELFTTDLAERCDAADLSFERFDDVSRVSIDDVNVRGDTASVDVVITHSSVDDPLNASTWDEQATFVLTDDDGWKLEEFSWPYVPCRWDTP